MLKSPRKGHFSTVLAPLTFSGLPELSADIEIPVIVRHHFLVGNESLNNFKSPTALLISPRKGHFSTVLAPLTFSGLPELSADIEVPVIVCHSMNTGNVSLKNFISHTALLKSHRKSHFCLSIAIWPFWGPAEPSFCCPASLAFRQTYQIIQKS